MRKKTSKKQNKKKSTSFWLETLVNFLIGLALLIIDKVVDD